MSASEDKLASDIHREARAWFVRLLDDRVEGEEVAAWEAWLLSSPDHAEAYDRVADAWALAGEAGPMETRPEDVARDRYDAEVPVRFWRRPRPRLRLVRAPLLIGLGVTLLVCGVFGFDAFKRLNAPAQVISTARAEHKSALLPDGSRILLGGMTAVDVKYDRRKRAVTLQGGEALFQVAHESSRPFVVQTPLGQITAVGTAFNVGVAAGRVSLIVTEGVVNVSAPGSSGRGGPVVLRVIAGQKVTMNKSGPLSVSNETASAGAAWANGRLEYRNEPLGHVIDDVNRYASRRIIIQDPAIGALEYTGTVQLQAADSWAQGLRGAFPLVVEPTKDGALILKKAPDVIPLSDRRSS